MAVRQLCQCRRSGRDYYRHRCPQCGLATEWAPRRIWTRAKGDDAFNRRHNQALPDRPARIEAILAGLESPHVPEPRVPVALAGVPEDAPAFRSWRYRASMWHACTEGERQRAHYDAAREVERLIVVAANRATRRAIVAVLNRELPRLLVMTSDFTGLFSPWPGFRRIAKW